MVFSFDIYCRWHYHGPFRRNREDISFSKNEQKIKAPSFAYSACNSLENIAERLLTSKRRLLKRLLYKCWVPQGFAYDPLLFLVHVDDIDSKRREQEQWEEAVNSIDFLHSSRKAWSTTNKLTSRSGCSSRLCPISTNSIASQLVKNGTQKTGRRESCPTYGRSQHLREKVSVAVLGQSSLLPPSGAWSQESLWDWILFSRCLYSTPSRLSNPFYNFFIFCMRQFKISGSGEEH